MQSNNSAEQFRRKLLAIALNDLKAARLLYRRGFYPQAVFFFQQVPALGVETPKEDNESPVWVKRLECAGYTVTCSPGSQGGLI